MRREAFVGEEGNTRNWAGRGWKTVVFKHLGRAMCREPAGVAETSFRVRLQGHPIQTSSKGKFEQDSSTPTAHLDAKFPDAAREQ
jgi:hypothetical protein